MNSDDMVTEPGNLDIDLNSTKLKLVNLVCASLISEPKFEGQDAEKTNALRDLVKEVAKGDPEFILKLALYVRDDLNIRTTANFLLALASNIEACAPFLKKYFRATIKLPSDWLAVASLYQKLPDKNLDRRALPTALRKAMKHKFPDFDAYQLAKYNKEGKAKRKAKKAKKDTGKKGKQQIEAQKRPEISSEKKELTMKQMIRQLHISEPIDHVMCLLGKKYPANLEEFQKSNLSGEFDRERAGKRMKLPVPETWETLLSAKGNKADTWEELIDHKKLPFMAMLRNLRNLILSGVSHRHHSWALSKLNNEGVIANSKQFPFRFFSAYEAIDINLQELKEEIEEAKRNPTGSKKGKQPQKKKIKGKAAEASKGVRKKKVIIPKHMPDANLIAKYRNALDTAVKYATVHNIKPIRGSTAVFCDVSASMREECKTARGMGAIKKTHQVGILLGLMCKYMCEECDFLAFSSPVGKGKSYSTVDLIDGTILQNMKVVEDFINRGILGDERQLPFEYLENLIADRKKIDSLIILSNTFTLHEDMKNMLKKYRQEINPDLLFVNVNLGATAAAISSINEQNLHPNDVLISGFSDAILRYVAERGDGNQLQYIQHIDQVKALHERINLPRISGYKIPERNNESKTSAIWSFMDKVQNCKFEGCGKKIAKQKIQSHMLECEFRPTKCRFQGCTEELPTNQIADHETRCPYQVSKKAETGSGWRSARLFVSSTFLDMHGERDVLVRIVFPELKERCKKRKINFYDVDLRWGVTREEAENISSPYICLNEIDRCRPFFLGMLGERYGWVPETYLLPDEPRFEWVKRFPKGRSITELEMWYGALLNPDSSRAAFFLRDPSFMESMMDDHRRVFDSESPQAKESIQRLKEKIQERCNYQTYQCDWSVVDKKPVTTKLEQFAYSVLETLWSSICEEFPEDPKPEDPLAIDRHHHEFFRESRSRLFVGRKDVLNKVFKFADSDQTGPLLIHSKPGEGKSSTLAFFASEYTQHRPGAFVLTHFTGNAPGSTDLRKMLVRLCSELAARFNIKEEIPDQLEELITAFPRFLEQGSLGAKVVIVIDALNKIRQPGFSLDWLPSSSNPSIRLIVSTYTDTRSFEALRLRKPAVPIYELPTFDMEERKQLVRSILWEYRKRLDESSSNNQMRALLRKTDSSKPLYLALACEELRVFGVYEQVTNRINKMAATLNKLFEEMLLRLETDFGQLFKNLMSLLACSREGLRETEVLYLLSSDEKPITQAAWSKLFAGVQSLLRPLEDTNDGVLDFFHDQLLQVINKRYLTKPEQVLHSHKTLAKYFTNQLFQNGKLVVHNRALSELPYHLSKARASKALVELLCNLSFVESKCSAGMAFELVNDYHLAFSIIDSTKETKEKSSLLDFFSFVSSNTHRLATDPQLTYQLASNQPDESLVSQVAKSMWLKQFRKPWIKWINKPQDHDPCMLTMAGSNEPVMACAYSPDGSQVVIACRDRSLKIKDAKSGNEIATLTGHSNWVVDCAYSPDGRMIVSASWDTTLKIWDVQSATEIISLVGHSRRVSGCSFSHDGKFISSSSWDCSIKLWEVETGKCIKTLSGHTKPVNACSFSPDDTRLVSASWDTSIRLWDIESGKELLSMTGHSKSVRAVDFSPNGRLIVSTSADCSVKVWDSATGSLLHTLTGHSMPVNTCAFSIDGKQLVSASDDQTIKIWDVLGGREVAKLRSVTSVGFTACSFSPDGRKIAAAQADCMLTSWDVLTGDQLSSVSAHEQLISSCVYSPGGDLIATASEDGLVCLWDSHTLQKVTTLRGHGSGVNDCVFSSDGRQLVTCSDDSTLRLWDVRASSCLRVLEGHSAAVRACAIAPNGKLIASASKDGSIMIWDVARGVSVNTFFGHRDWVNSLTISADSRFLISGSWDFDIKMWELSSGKEVFTLTGHQSAVTSCQISPDGRRIISASLDSTVKIWDTKELVCINTLEGHSSRINDVSLSKDGKMILSVSDDSTMRLWDAVAGTEVASLTGHSGVIRSIAFSSTNDKLLISASEDCTVKVWNPLGATPDTSSSSSSSFSYSTTSEPSSSSSSAPQQVRAAHSLAINGCAFSGDLLATASRDKCVKVWSFSKSTSSTRQPLKQLYQFEGHTKSVNSCAFLTGNKLATASDQGPILIWDLDYPDGKPVELSGHVNSVKSLSSSASILISAGWDNVVNVWKTNSSNSSKPSGTLRGHSDWINECRFSDDGSAIVSSSHDNSVRLWDANTLVCQRDFSNLPNWAHSACLSSDNKYLAAACHDASIHIWDVRQKNQHSLLSVHKTRVNRVKFVPGDPMTLVSCSHDGSVKVLNWTTKGSDLVNSEFHGKGPQTALDVHDTQKSLIASADSLGNLYLMQIISP